MIYIKNIMFLIFSMVIFASVAHAGITKQQKEKTVKVLSEYYKKIKTVQANFVHITDKNKQLSGRFYMQLPGKIRFEYQGNKLNIVGSGAWLNVDYPQRRKATRYPLSQTPLGVLLDDNIDFDKDFIYTKFVQKKGYFIVKIQLEGKEEIGSIDLFFVGKNNELRQWRITDAQGKANVVALSDLVYNKPIKKNKFFLKDYVEFKNDR